jgi:hypothetical protein
MVLLNMKKVGMLVSELRFNEIEKIFLCLCMVEEALHALDRYRLLGRELEVEFARGDRKSKFFILFYSLEINFCFLAPSEMRAREKESRHSGGRGGGDSNRRDRSRR